MPQRIGRIIPALLVLLVFLPEIPGVAKGGASPQEFPAQDIRVLSNGSTTGTLKLRFEALGSRPTYPLTGRNSTFFVAGSPKRLPSAKVTRAHYYRVRGRQFVGEVHDVPFANDSGTARQQVVRFTDLGAFRQFHLYGMILSTSFVAAPGLPSVSEFWVMDFVEIEVDLGPPALETPEELESAGKFRVHGNTAEFDEALLLNPDIAPAFYQVASTRDWSRTRDWVERVNRALSIGEVFKLRIYEPGVYLVSSRRLEEASRSSKPERQTRIASPGQWRLLHNGVEEPLLLEQAASGQIALFVVPPFDRALKDSDVYWLDVSGDPEADTSAPLRMKVPPAESAETVLREPTTTPLARFESVAAELGDYQSRIRPSNEVTKWFWKGIPDGEIGAFAFPLPEWFGGAAPVDLLMYFAMPVSTSSMPSLELLVNGGSVGIMNAPGSQGMVTFHVPARLLRAGSNDVGIRVRYANGGFAEKPDILVQKFVARWSQRLDTIGYPVEPFHLDESGTAPVMLRFAQSGTTETTAPLRLFNIGGGAPYVVPRLDSGVFVDARRGGGAYILSGAGRAQMPPVIEPGSRLTLLDGEFSADYIAISHRSLLSALEPLLERRRADGFKPLSVDVESIFDNFSYGFKDPEAIKGFLSYAFYEWSAPKVSHVLLVGEASEYRGDPAAAPAKCQLDLVPTNGNARSDSPRGDHAYSTIAGGDALSDVALGRLSVATPDELTSALAKMAEYETAPIGEWALQALFVSDDNEEFPRVVNEVIERAVAPPADVRHFRESDFRYVPNIKVYGKRRSWDATRELIRSLNDGAGLVSFFGHGGPNLWTHERLFHVADLALLHNAPRLPLVSCASCDNAWLDYPIPPVNVSMGEMLVKRPGCGAIGVFAPVSGASPYEHSTLMSRLAEALYRRNLRRLGDLTLYAKNCYFGETQSGSLPDQYILVGDPALKLRIPVIEESLDVEPRALPAGTVGIVTASADNVPDDVVSGTLVFASAHDSSTRISRTVAFLGGQMRAEIPVDRLREGTYRLLMHYESQGQLRLRAGRLDVQEPQLAFDEDAASPDSILGAKDVVDAKLRFFNPTLPRIESGFVNARFEDDSGNNNGLILDELFGLANGAAREFQFAWDARHPNALRAIWGSTSPETPERNARVEVVRWDDESSWSLAIPTGIRVAAPEERSETENFTFSCEIWNRGTCDIESAQAILSEGGEPIADPYTITNLAPGGKRGIALTSRKTFPAGETSVTLAVHKIDREGTASVSRLLLTHTEHIRILPGPDIGFVAGSAHVELPPDGLIARTSVPIRVELRNSGGTTARNFPIQVLVDNPTTGTEGMMLNEVTNLQIPELRPGETIPVVVRWEDCMKAGEQRVWIVANRQKTARETDYDNNAIEVPPFSVRQLGDFRLTSLQVEPLEAEAGTTLTVAFTVSNDADTTRGPVDVEFGSRNPLTGARKPQNRKIPVISANGMETVRAQVPMEPGMTEFYAIANSTKDLEESDAGGNEAHLDLHPVVVLAKGRDPASARIDLGRFFAGSAARNMELIPGGPIRLQDRFTSSPGAMPVDPAWLVSGEVAKGGVTPVDDSDGKWLLGPWRLEAARDEGAGPVALRIPGASAREGLLHDVFVLSVSSMNYKGGRAGTFEAQIEGEPPRRFDFAAQSPWSQEQRIALGKHDLRDGALDITISPTTGSAAALISFELVPAAGLVTSPILRLPGIIAPGAAALKFDDSSTSPGEMIYSYRLGAEDRRGGIEWADWRRLDGREGSLAGGGNRLQWRLEVLPSGDNRPVLRRAELTLP